MSRINYIESFPTIDLCVDYLISRGCKWTAEKEKKLTEKASYQFNDIMVFYDPHNLLSI